MSKKSPLNYFKYSDDFVVFKAGQQVFVEGQEGDTMFVVMTLRYRLSSANFLAAKRTRVPACKLAAVLSLPSTKNLLC